MLQRWAAFRAGKWLLGLCNANHCSGGAAGLDRGNGRIIVSLLNETSTRCAWEPQRVLSIPATAAFSEYTGIAIRGNRLLIASRVGPFHPFAPLCLIHPVARPWFPAALTSGVSCEHYTSCKVR
jgi:hypothetical protein